MVLPLAVIGAMGIAGGLSTVHKGLQYAENRRYWREYQKILVIALVILLVQDTTTISALLLLE